jgi:ketosteroid isomerase-like protein
VSAANVQLVRETYEAFNRDGSAGTIPFMHPDVVWDESDLVARNPGIYRGHDGVLRLGRENSELWREIKAEVDELIDAGDDRVVAGVRVQGKGKFTDESVELAITQVWQIRDGKAWRVKLYLDRQEALEAAGLEA